MKITINPYCIISKESLVDLQIAVNKLYDEGFVAQGGPFVTYDHEVIRNSKGDDFLVPSRIQYHQAMVEAAEAEERIEIRVAEPTQGPIQGVDF